MPEYVDALDCVLVTLEEAGLELTEWDTVPSALAEYFAEEGQQ
jgi:hypothetical protein